MSKPRVVFIGIDGAAVTLLRPWIEDGVLPNFSQAAQSGIMADLRSVVPPMTASAWVSISTGKNPGKHGVFDFYRTTNYEKQVISSNDIRAQHVWQLLSKAGKKVIVVNPPVSFPPDEVNGYFVGGMLTPSYASDYTYPLSLKAELKKLGYSIGVELDPGMRSNYARSFVMSKNQKTRQKLIDVFNAIAQRRVDVIEHLTKKIDWDFIYVMFEGADRLQHYYWDADDFYVIREHYRKIDELVGRLMNLQDGNTVFIVGSDHGFAGIEYKFFVNNFLAYHNLLVPSQEAKRKGMILTMAKTMAGMLAACGVPVQKFLSSHGVFRFYKDLYRPFVDWEKTKAFMFNETSRGIWINLKNRQSKGTVDKNEYQHLRSFIVKELNQLKDPQTGERIVTAYAREDVYEGLHTHNAPDILLVTHDKYSVEPVIKPNTNALALKGFIEKTGLGERNADHTMNGLFMMFGSGIKHSDAGQNTHVTDIAPTILSLLGLAVPCDMDGVSRFEQG